MGDLERFSKRYQERLNRHKKEAAAEASAIELEMARMLERRESFIASSKRIMQVVVHPRVQKVCDHFENARIEVAQDLSCLCRFIPTVQYPARVAVGFSIFPEESFKKLSVRYSLELLPVLLEYQPSDQRTFALAGAEGQIADWVEEKLFGFLETYLLLESHPLYQRENVVTDPVCAMRILKANAVVLEHQGYSYYFCSKQCEQTFLDEAKTA